MYLSNLISLIPEDLLMLDPERIKIIDTEKKKVDRLEKLVLAIRSLMENKFTGYIKLNFTQGSIGRIEKFEEFCTNKQGTLLSDIFSGTRKP